MKPQIKDITKSGSEGSTKSNFHKVSDSKQSVAEIITDLIINKLEAGVIPWRKPWSGSKNAPQNLFSKKPYRGVNAFILCCCGHASPFYATFNQITEHNGSVKKGAKSIPIVFYSIKEIEDRTTSEEISIPVLRYFRVFSFDDIEGITAPCQEEITREFTPIEEAERIVNNMPLRPEIKSVEAKAYYSPSLDYVNKHKVCRPWPHCSQGMLILVKKSTAY